MTPRSHRRRMARLVPGALHAVARTTLRPTSRVLRPSAPGIAAMEALLGGILHTVARPRPDTRVVPVDTTTHRGRIRGEWVQAGRARQAPLDGPALLYLHGGAFVACSPRTHRGLIAELSAASGLPVFALTYRKAPDHPHPTASDDAARALSWLRTTGDHDRPIALAGDSAGGWLALTLTRHALATGTPPASLLLLSPLVDLTLGRAFTRQAMARTPDPFAVPAAALRMVTAYLGTTSPRAPDVCILDTDLSGFPPTMVHVGSTEMLLDDARDLADQLSAAGVDVRLHVWRRQLHVFPALYRLVHHARTALRLSGTFLADTTARPHPQPERLLPA